MRLGHGAHLCIHAHSSNFTLSPHGGLRLPDSPSDDRRPERSGTVSKTGGFRCIITPRTLPDNSLQPHATSLDKPNEASAFIAVILAFLGLADLTAASLSEQTSLEYWLSNVPVRLTFLFILSGYIYTFKDDGIFGSKSLLRQASPGDLLRNSLVFTWAFMETAAWFWVG